MIHLRKIGVDDAVDIICHAARLPHFAATAESQERMNDLLLAARVRIAIIDEWADLTVSASGGNVTVHLEAPLAQETAIRSRIIPLVTAVPGVKKHHRAPASNSDVGLGLKVSASTTLLAPR